jgi:sulfur-oxidizing protein SoxZ
MAKKPRVKVPKSASKGDIIQIKTLISHKMETGTRKGKDGKLIPRMIINNFTCSFEGKEVFSANMHPAVAANPYFAFYATATKSGNFEFAWTDDKGKKVTQKRPIKVS